MESIAFVDTEIDPLNHRILDIAAIKGNGASLHKNSIPGLIEFLAGVRYIGGHNIFRHDLLYVGEAVRLAGIDSSCVIDTLFWSALLFPAKPYHGLLKDDKLQTEETNNPLNDAIKARDLFYDEVAVFNKLTDELKAIFYGLLSNKQEFAGFFRFAAYGHSTVDMERTITRTFKGLICANVRLDQLISGRPVELAYCLSLLTTNDRESVTPPWVSFTYPRVGQTMRLLRGTPCISGCPYCDSTFNIRLGLKRFFGYDSFRTYAGIPLQEKAVQAAIDAKSILAVFPTGGGKSITFQLPALMSGEMERGLTVVISPLQSLMKDQVDNLEKMWITEAVTINGLLDVIERSKVIERLENGSVSLLYISPESLRSKTIERLLLGRKVVRFVIDEAHCFSAWGQDFRVDYLYIGDFIRQLREKKGLDEEIPVSCFTATAKQKVIQDIKDYFRAKLSLELELFTSDAARTNLSYTVLSMEDDNQKYQTVRDLIEDKNSPTIVYVSRTRAAERLAARLSDDGFTARPFHGRMDARIKTENQNAFISGEISIIVATSAFGMGVDKKDVGLVIHYDISDSLENYVQEAGRAGRDENLRADCYVLYNEEDLGKHFMMLNQSKLSVKEIQQVWKAIKDFTRFRSTISNSALEIARQSGWDDNILDIETRVTTAIAALEDAGYVRRGQNMPRVFANSILAKNAQEASDKINASSLFHPAQKEGAIRIIKKLLSARSRKHPGEEPAESRIDYISDHLGISRDKVIGIINLLRSEKILADAKDLTAFIRRGENKNRSLQIIESFVALERFLFSCLEERENVFHIKKLNEEAEAKGGTGVTPGKIRAICNFWAVKDWVKRQHSSRSKNHLAFTLLEPKEAFRENMEKRHLLARRAIEFLFEKVGAEEAELQRDKDEVLVEFSVQDVKKAYEGETTLFDLKVSIAEVEDALFYLSRAEAIKIEGGFLVLYNQLTIERLEQDNKKRYTKTDYSKLNQFYENKIAQIHIIGEYAKKMMSDHMAALQFVDDYFKLGYETFVRKYFPGNSAGNLTLKMTPAKFRQLFGELSPAQLKIINNTDSKYIVVAAGPGSGKTKLLVHKLASLLLMEDVRHEQLLMVTFSRAAASEFKHRLLKLVGNAANFVEIKTFHSYCFDLLGKVGSLEKSDDIIKTTIKKIRDGEVEASQITKMVLVIDEAQDMDGEEYGLISLLMELNEEMRLIAVGDDDQNIYEFRGASARYLEFLVTEQNAVKYELGINYRSKNNLVEFANRFVAGISHRLKQEPIVASQKDNGHIKIIRYRSSNMIIPLVEALFNSSLAGTTCVLTRSNDEASQVAGLLSRYGLTAKLVQSNDGFSMLNLLELRTFYDQLQASEEAFIISGEVWEQQVLALKDRFKRSSKLDLCLNLLAGFHTANPGRKYKSDFEVFVRESRMEDFFTADGETIFVSTIHKAKGKEFDNVFLMLNGFDAISDEDRRQVYVAVTRAIRSLSIHTNTGAFDSIVVEDAEIVRDEVVYLPPDELAMHLTFRDVWLDYFINKQDIISRLTCGDNLIVHDDGCLTVGRQTVIKFSRQFCTLVEARKANGYRLVSARINFIVYWRKEGLEEDVKIILPEVWFQRDAPVLPPGSVPPRGR